MTSTVLAVGGVVGHGAGPAAVALREGVVESIGPVGAAGGGGAGSVDLADLVLAPGFVDLQCNGAFGIDLASAPERMWELASALAATGVTAFLPTLVSASTATVEAAQRTLAARPEGFAGAEPLGLHLEGPVIAPARRGAHPATSVRSPAAVVDEARRWTRAHGVRMVTLAPELPGALELVRRLAADGVVVAIGHTDATEAQAAAAFEAGASAVTHLFNAMRPFHHREAGPLGAALARPGVRVGLIADGVHVAPSAVLLAWRLFGPDRLVLVTDSVAAAPGERDARTADGALAGSVLTMDEAVRSLVALAGCSLAEAVAAASTVPAGLLGRPADGVVPGAPADLVLLDGEGRVALTLVGGRPVFDPNGRWA